MVRGDDVSRVVEYVAGEHLWARAGYDVARILADGPFLHSTLQRLEESVGAVQLHVVGTVVLEAIPCLAASEVH